MGGQTNFNIGIATGEQSSFWALDIDPYKGGADSLAALEAKHGPLPDTLTNLTGNDGEHRLFRMPPEFNVRNMVEKFMPGLDVRGTGGQIVVFPSTHPNGKIYKWKDEAAPIADAPDWLLNIIRGKKNAPSRQEYAPTDHVSGDWVADDIISMLDCLDPDDWRNVGMALHDGGWPLAMWDACSRGFVEIRGRRTGRFGATRVAVEPVWRRDCR